MGSVQDVVVPLVVDAQADVASIRSVLASIGTARERQGTLALRRPWILVRSTRGFAVHWHWVSIDELFDRTAESVSPSQRLSDVLPLVATDALPVIQLAQLVDETPGQTVVLNGDRLFGFVPPKQRAANGGSRSVSTRSAPAARAPRTPGATTSAPAVSQPPTLLTASAFVDAPRRVQPGQPFVLSIGLSATAVVGVEGGDLIIELAADESEFTLGVEVEAPSFSCDTGFSHVLRVTRADPFSPRSTMTLTAAPLPDGVDEELRAIRVSYTKAGLTCGIATWRIVVQRHDNAVAEPPRATSGVAMNLASPSIDLTLRCAWLNDNEATHTLQWSYSTPHAVAAPAGKMVRSSPELATLPLGIVDELAQGDGQEGIELLMAGIAQRIADEIPRGVWDVLRAVTQSVRTTRGPQAIPTVLLLTQETRVPWELALLPEDLGDSGTDQLRLIGTEFAVSRWVLDDNIPPLPPADVASHQVLAVYGDYTGTAVAELPWAKKEAAYLQEKHGRSVSATRSAILAVLQDKPLPDASAPAPLGILHFAGHGEAARPGTPASFIVLSDGSNLTSTYFLNAPALKKHAPLVFLNACQLGAATGSLGQPGGFAVVFVRARCSAVIAPLWSVNDEVAYDVATHFYDAILGTPGTSVAATMRQLRQPRFSDITLKDTSGAPAVDATGAPLTRRTATRLAYLVYGHPDLHF